ncbi:MAG: rhodanese-like domain-containing protein [Acidimicrobiales bacterium]
MVELRVVSPAEVHQFAGQGSVLLDVRDEREWALGRAPGATHIPLAELPDRVDELSGASTIVCVCRSGGRSRRAAIFLLDHGVDAVNLDGGMIAWVESGGPLESDGGEPTIL